MIFWNKVYKDFKKTYPSLSKDCVHFHPQGFMTIVVYLSDGTKLSYNYETGRAVVLKDRWRK